MSIKYYINTIKRIIENPLNQNRKLAAIKHFIVWRIKGRIKRHGLIYDWVDGSKFYFCRREWGIVGNAYMGLLEFEEMAFLLHVLRDTDVFIDVGANHGSYSLLASSVIGATSISFEPIPATYRHLVENVTLNQINHKVKCINKGVGSEAGIQTFVFGDISSLSHIILPSENRRASIDVAITTLDEELNHEYPCLIKIDVEGFEKAVLDGAKKTLQKESVLSVIIELNKFDQKYGFDEAETIDLLFSFGFFPYSYNPFDRSVKRLSIKNVQSKNTIFIRDLELVEARIKKAPKVLVFGQEI